MARCPSNDARPPLSISLQCLGLASDLYSSISLTRSCAQLPQELRGMLLIRIQLGPDHATASYSSAVRTRSSEGWTSRDRRGRSKGFQDRCVQRTRRSDRTLRRGLQAFPKLNKLHPLYGLHSIPKLTPDEWWGLLIKDVMLDAGADRDGELNYSSFLQGWL